MGTRSSKLPVTLGHENAGWVEKLELGNTGFAQGDPVIVQPRAQIRPPL